MIVASCQIELYLLDSQSLKDKRAVIKSLKERIRQKFNVSIAEVSRLNDIKFGVLGLAIVSNDKKILESTFSKILNQIEKDGRADIANQLFELR